MQHKVNMTGKDNKITSPTTLLENLKVWGWFAVIKQLHASDLFVTDEDIATALKTEVDSAECQFSSSDEYKGKLPGAFKRVIFLCRGKEYSFVRKARKRWPTLEIYSGTYDIAPAGMSSKHGVRLDQVLDRIRKPKALNPANNPVVIFTVRGSDIGYLSRLMKNGSLPAPILHFDHSLVAWASEQSDFQLARYVNQVIRSDAAAGFSTYIESDVLKALMKAVSLTPEKLEKMILNADAKVIYFSRRDKSLQAVTLAALEKTTFKSLWDMSRKEARMISASDCSLDALYSLAQSLVLEEAELEEVLTVLSEFKMVTLEELIESPIEVLESMALYLQSRIDKNMQIPDFYGRYRDVQGLGNQANGLRSDIASRFNLVKNDAGSYVSEMETSSNR